MHVYCSFILYILGYDKTFNVQPQPIQFVKEPTDHVTLTGESVTFVCSTTSDGLSKPGIIWFHNNSKIRSGHPHYNISHNGSSTGILTIINVTVDDQGLYHCCVDDWKAKIRSNYGRLNGRYYLNIINS